MPAKPHVLVAEDDPDFRHLVVNELEREGFMVSSVPDGRKFTDYIAGIILYSRDRPDVIVSDIRMPGADGLTMLEAVRGIEWSTPVILMTGFGTSVEATERAKAANVVAVLDKPFDFDELKRLIYDVTGRAGKAN